MIAARYKAAKAAGVIAARYKARYEAAKAAGMCPSHPSTPAIPGQVYCNICLDSEKARYEAAKAAGMCPYHPSTPALPDQVHCRECLDRRDASRPRCACCEEVEISHSTYGDLCVGCYALQYPLSALAKAPKYHKTEILLWALLNHHFKDYKVVKREYLLRCGEKRCRIDFILQNGEVKVSIEVDGQTHFVDWPELGTKVDAVVANDVEKMIQDWRNDGDKPVLRIHQPSAWYGCPVDFKTPITFDTISAIAHLSEVYQGQKVVVFVEPVGNSDYNKMKDACTAAGFKWVTFDPTTVAMALLPDAREVVFWTRAGALPV